MSYNNLSVVELNNISKLYRLYAYQGSIRTAFTDFTRNLFSSHREEKHSSLLWALKDINFHIKKGESLGIIGPNGAGKTTILKLISRVTKPTEGNIKINGHLASVIELAAGFHPDLTGRENIYLYGSIMGMPRQVIKTKIDTIVDFSGLNRFIDTPIKRYSTGMYVRLAFSVAIHTDPDILLIDEVLAVGDAEFRQKCIEKINNLRHNGVTIVFISHNLFQMRAVCDRGIFLCKGKIDTIGSSDKAIEAYEHWIRTQILNDEPYHKSNSLMPESLVMKELQIQRVTIVNDLDENVLKLSHDDPVEIRIHYNAQQIYPSMNFDVRIIRTDGIVCALIRSRDLNIHIGDISNRGYISIKLTELQLTTGTYYIEVRLRDMSDAISIAEGQSNVFEVCGPGFFGEVVSAVFLPNIISVNNHNLSNPGKSCK